MRERTSNTFLRVQAIGSMICLTLVTSCSDPEARRIGTEQSTASNLLFVSIDTTRADHLSSYGYGRETSPHLDSLASHGHLFSNAHTVMPTTLPSHAAMFTSLYPREIGTLANGMVVPPEAHTLAERLTENGISTAAFVSAAVLHPRLGLDQGFDVYDHPTGSERRGEETRARASAWLRQIGDHRFFCFVHLYDPHTWYTPPEPYREMYGVPPGQHPPDRTFVRDPSLLTPSAIRNAIDAYDAEIQYADAQLGALLQTLDELDLRKNTVVVVLSDHGESLDELLEEFGYAFDHGEFLYRSELRIPLVLWTPRSMGLPAGTIQDAIVTTLDLMPTLLELLGIPGHGGARGRSLIPLLSGSLLPPRPAFADRRLLTRAEVMQPPSRFLQGEEISVTTRKWHFLRCEGRPDELFDLASDPLETLNVVDTEPKVAERMRRLIDLRRPFDQTDRVPSSTVDPELAEKLRSLGYVVDSPNS